MIHASHGDHTNTHFEFIDLSPFHCWFNSFWLFLASTQINCKNIYIDILRSFLGNQIISNTINAVSGRLQSVQHSDFDLFCIDFDWSTIECFIVIKRQMKKQQPILNDMKSHNDQKSWWWNHFFCKRMNGHRPMFIFCK